MKILARVLSLGLAVALAPAAARATPSTTFWAPSTPYVQPFGVLHVTYDTYFGTSALYPVDVGLTIGVLPWKGLQAELGFDLFYPTVGPDGKVDLPIVLNGKIGAPEDVYFPGQPAWSVGIFGVGFEKDVNNQNAIYAMLGKTLPYIGMPELGVYYGLNDKLFVSASGEKAQFGVLAGWFSPPIDVPVIDKIMLTWDLQTGASALGATGGGVYVYFTPAIDLLTGPVFFFEKELQPDMSSWMWTVQLDVDVDLLAGGK